MKKEFKNTSTNFMNTSTNTATNMSFSKNFQKPVERFRKFAKISGMVVFGYALVYTLSSCGIPQNNLTKTDSITSQRFHDIANKAQTIDGLKTQIIEYEITRDSPVHNNQLVVIVKDSNQKFHTITEDGKDTGTTHFGKIDNYNPHTAMDNLDFQEFADSYNKSTQGCDNWDNKDYITVLPNGHSHAIFGCETKPSNSTTKAPSYYKNFEYIQGILATTTIPDNTYASMNSYLSNDLHEANSIFGDNAQVSSISWSQNDTQSSTDKSAWAISFAPNSSEKCGVKYIHDHSIGFNPQYDVLASAQINITTTCDDNDGLFPKSATSQPLKDFVSTSATMVSQVNKTVNNTTYGLTSENISAVNIFFNKTYPRAEILGKHGYIDHTINKLGQEISGE